MVDQSIHPPAHTPACVSYRIGDALFTGDAAAWATRSRYVFEQVHWPNPTVPPPWMSSRFSSVRQQDWHASA